MQAAFHNRSHQGRHHAPVLASTISDKPKSNRSAAIAYAVCFGLRLDLSVLKKQKAPSATQKHAST